MSTFVASTAAESLPPLQLLLRQKEAIKVFSGESTSVNYLNNNGTFTAPDTPKPLAWAQPTQDVNNCGALCMAPSYSADGKLVCYVAGTEDRVRVFNASSDTSSAPILDFECSDVLSAEFSPLGTYLVTWSRPLVTGRTNTNPVTAGTGNMRVWDVATGALVAHYSQRVQKNDVIQWSPNEHLCMKIVTNEVHILNGHDLTAGIKCKVYCKNVTQFKMAYVGAEEGNGEHYCEVACFSSSVGGGTPAQAAIYRVLSHASPSAVVATGGWWARTADNATASATAAAASASAVEVVGPIVSRGSLLGATGATLLWNAPLNNTVLVFTHADVDNSGASYYGRTGAFILSHPPPSTATAAPIPPNANPNNVTIVASALSMLVPQTKAGPVYDLAWSPTGLHFILVGGTMPSNATLFNIKGDALYEFGTAHRNTVCWSPHGRFFCISGLGNLAGEMDFYEINIDNKNKIKKIGNANAHCTVQYGWSPDSRFFMTATLAPRMNVDNGFKVYKYNGQLVYSHDCVSAAAAAASSSTAAYDCIWRPAAPRVYPNRSRSPQSASSAAAATAATATATATAAAAKPAAPAAAPYRPRGSTGALSEMMKRGNGAVTTAGKVAPAGAASAPAPVVLAPSKYKAPERRIPGMAPAAPVAAAKTQEKPKPASPKAKSNPTPPPAPAPAPAPAVAEDPEKKAKNLRKKLRQIDELQAKVDSGEQITAEQRDKLATRPTVEAELAALAI